MNHEIWDEIYWWWREKNVLCWINLLPCPIMTYFCSKLKRLVRHRHTRMDISASVGEFESLTRCSEAGALAGRVCVTFKEETLLTLRPSYDCWHKTLIWHRENRPGHNLAPGLATRPCWLSAYLHQVCVCVCVCVCAFVCLSNTMWLNRRSKGTNKLWTTSLFIDARPFSVSKRQFVKMVFRCYVTPSVVQIIVQ